MEELNIGVIGAGGRGYLAEHAHRPEQGVRLAAGADIDAKALDLFREKYGPDVYVTDDYRKLLELDHIQAVFITSPDYLHEEHAVAALRAGMHVYLEKPMAITIQGCDRILQAARDTGMKLYLGHNMRHHIYIQKMKELIDGGAIGEVKAGWCRHFVAYGCDAYFKDWHAERRNTTSLLLQKGAHDIDVLHWLCGGYSVRVTGMGGLTLYDQIPDRHDPSEKGDSSWHLENWPPLSQKGLNPVIDVEDLNMMLMELDNGVFCSYQQCHYTPDAWRNYTIIGTEGRIENFSSSPPVVRLWNKRCSFREHGNEEIECQVPEGGHGGADPLIVDEFLRYIREQGSATTSPVAARMSVAAGCRAAESIRNGSRPRDVPLLENDLLDYFYTENQ